MCSLDDQKRSRKFKRDPSGVFQGRFTNDSRSFEGFSGGLEVSEALHGISGAFCGGFRALQSLLVTFMGLSGERYRICRAFQGI